MDILTMNQNVFGSSFETTRRTNFTENAINSELIIPTSAVELSYEEVEYIDGGATNVYRGIDGWVHLTNIAANIWANFKLTASLFASAAASAATVVGVIWSIVAAVGGTITMANTFLASANLLLAIGFMMAHNGYQEKGWSVLGFGFTLILPI